MKVFISVSLIVEICWMLNVYLDMQVQMKVNRVLFIISRHRCLSKKTVVIAHHEQILDSVKLTKQLIPEFHGL